MGLHRTLVSPDLKAQYMELQPSQKLDPIQGPEVMALWELSLDEKEPPIAATLKL